MIKECEKDDHIIELDRVKQKLKILDMIEDRLVRMQKLAEIVAKEKLTEEQAMSIQEKFSALEAELNLLGLEREDLFSRKMM